MTGPKTYDKCCINASNYSFMLRSPIIADAEWLYNLQNNPDNFALDTSDINNRQNSFTGSYTDRIRMKEGQIQNKLVSAQRGAYWRQDKEGDNELTLECIELVIVMTKGPDVGKQVGWITIDSIASKNEAPDQDALHPLGIRAEYNCVIDKNHHGKGLGFESLEVAVKFVFEEVFDRTGPHKYYMSTLSSNPDPQHIALISALQKAGWSGSASYPDLKRQRCLEISRKSYFQRKHKSS